MELKQLEKILNACWKASATERFLLNNAHGVFTRLTGAVIELAPPQLAVVKSFALLHVDGVQIYVRSNLGGFALAKRGILEDQLTLAAEELRKNHATVHVGSTPE